MKHRNIWYAKLQDYPELITVQIQPISNGDSVHA